MIIATLAVAFLGLLACGRLMQFVAPSGSVTIPLPTLSFPMPEFSGLIALVLLAVGLGLHGWAKLAPRRIPANYARPMSGGNVVPFPQSRPVRRGRIERSR